MPSKMDASQIYVSVRLALSGMAAGQPFLCLIIMSWRRRHTTPHVPQFNRHSNRQQQTEKELQNALHGIMAPSPTQRVPAMFAPVSILAMCASYQSPQQSTRPISYAHATHFLHKDTFSPHTYPPKHSTEIYTEDACQDHRTPLLPSSHPPATPPSDTPWFCQGKSHQRRSTGDMPERPQFNVWCPSHLGQTHLACGPHARSGWARHWSFSQRVCDGRSGLLHYDDDENICQCND